MNHLEVMDTLKAILVDLGIPEASLCENTLLYGHLKLDSIEAVQLSLQLKRQLGIELKLGTRQDMTLAQICHLTKAPSSTQSS
jgi:acyl carrier protein